MRAIAVFNWAWPVLRRMGQFAELVSSAIFRLRQTRKQIQVIFLL